MTFFSPSLPAGRDLQGCHPLQCLNSNPGDWQGAPSPPAFPRSPRTIVTPPLRSLKKQTKGPRASTRWLRPAYSPVSHLFHFLWKRKHFTSSKSPTFSISSFFKKNSSLCKSVRGTHQKPQTLRQNMRSWPSQTFRNQSKVPGVHVFRYWQKRKWTCTTAQLTCGIYRIQW